MNLKRYISYFFSFVLGDAIKFFIRTEDLFSYLLYYFETCRACTLCWKDAQQSHGNLMRRESTNSCLLAEIWTKLHFERPSTVVYSELSDRVLNPERLNLQKNAPQEKQAGL